MAVATTLLLIAHKLHHGYFLGGYFTDHSLAKIAYFLVAYVYSLAPSGEVAAKVQLFNMLI